MAAAASPNGHGAAPFCPFSTIVRLVFRPPRAFDAAKVRQRPQGETPGHAQLDTPSYRIVIADDHPLFRGALREAVSGLAAGLTIAEAGSFAEVSEIIGADPDVDLVLLDLAMPGIKGFSGLMFLRAQYPGVPVVIVSATEDPNVIRRCFEFGASGFIRKTLGTEAMRDAVRTVLDGGTYVPPDIDLAAGGDTESARLAARLASLTPQQMRVLMMLSEGLLNKQIAYELTVSEATVKAHVSAILTKLGVDSRTQAVIAASRIAAEGWPGQALNG